MLRLAALWHLSSLSAQQTTGPAAAKPRDSTATRSLSSGWWPPWMVSKANSSGNVNHTRTPCVNTWGQPIQHCLLVKILIHSPLKFWKKKKKKHFPNANNFNFLLEVSKAEVSSLICCLTWMEKLFSDCFARLHPPLGIVGGGNTDVLLHKLSVFLWEKAVKSVDWEPKAVNHSAESHNSNALKPQISPSNYSVLIHKYRLTVLK